MPPVTATTSFTRRARRTSSAATAGHPDPRVTAIPGCRPRAGAGQAAAACGLLTALALALTGPVRAADPPPPAVPDAGSLLRQLPPPALAPRDPAQADAALPERRAAPPRVPAPPSQPFVLRAVRITGSSVYPEDRLLPLVSDALGRPVDLAGLEALADRLTDHYRANGHTVARAYLPPQDVIDGRVEIAVVEGRYGAITVAGPAPVARWALPLGSLVPGQVVTDGPLERALLLAADLPGLRVRSTLQPGASVGTSDLIVELAPDTRVSGRVELDNQGNASTGAPRLSADLAWNNPAGIGDVASLRSIVSEGDRLQHLRLAWQAPVPGLAASGTRLGVAAAHMRYRLGGDFASLQAHGRADIASLFALQPLLRSRDGRLDAQLLFDDKRLHDAIDSAGLANNKRLQLLGLGLSGQRVDGLLGGGATSFSATWSSGRLAIADPAAAAADDASARSRGHFDKFNLSVLRRQRLGDTASLTLQFSAQWASKNLDSSEKLALGGIGGVRAYATGEAPSDRACLLGIELRQPFGAGLEGLALLDVAQARTNARPWVADSANRRRLAGAGVGLAWAPIAPFSLQLVHARRLSGPDRASDNGRWWLQLGWQFL